MPAEVVVVERSTPVAVLMATTLASGTPPLLGSVTVPEMFPVVSCAGRPVARPSSRSAKKQTALMRMQYPLEKIWKNPLDLLLADKGTAFASGSSGNTIIL